MPVPTGNVSTDLQYAYFLNSIQLRKKHRHEGTYLFLNTSIVSVPVLFFIKYLSSKRLSALFRIPTVNLPYTFNTVPTYLVTIVTGTVG